MFNCNIKTCTVTRHKKVAAVCDELICIIYGLCIDFILYLRDESVYIYNTQCQIIVVFIPQRNSKFNYYKRSNFSMILMQKKTLKFLHVYFNFYALFIEKH